MVVVPSSSSPDSPFQSKVPAPENNSSTSAATTAATLPETPVALPPRPTPPQQTPGTAEAPPPIPEKPLPYIASAMSPENAAVTSSTVTPTTMAANTTTTSASGAGQQQQQQQQQQPQQQSQQKQQASSKTPVLQLVSEADEMWFALHSTACSISVPGLAPSQILKASELLMRDVKENHAWVDRQRGHHNHVSHHILNSLALGASAERLDEIYSIHKATQLPSLEYNPKAVITPGNIEYFRSNDAYFPNWFVFYLNSIKSSGGDWRHVLQTYFFHPSLFFNMVSGLMHPLVHLGLGAEFGCEALIAQGLAIGSITLPLFMPLFTPEGDLSGDGDYDPVVNKGLEALNKGFQMFGVSHQSSWRSKLNTSKFLSNKSGTSLLAILDQVRRDQNLQQFARNTLHENPFINLLRVAGKTVSKYAAQWKVAPDSTAIGMKLKELYMVTTHILASTPELDFSLMHGLSAASSLSTILSPLSTAYQARLLRAVWAVVLTFYLLAGSPELKFPDSVAPSPASGSNIEHWESIRARAVASNDPHVAKVIRALWRGSTMLAYPLSIEEQVVLHQWQQNGGPLGYTWPPIPDWTSLAERTLEQVKNSDHMASDAGLWATYICV